jgi:hypothetical protein
MRCIEHTGVTVSGRTSDEQRRRVRVQMPDALDNSNLFDGILVSADLVCGLFHLYFGHGSVGLFNLLFAPYAVTQDNVAGTTRALQVSSPRHSAMQLRANRLSAVPA